MRGRTDQQIPMFSVIPVDSWIEESHPIRAMAELVTRILDGMSAEWPA